LTPDPTGLQFKPGTPYGTIPIGSRLKFDQGSVQIHIYRYVFPHQVFRVIVLGLQVLDNLTPDPWTLAWINLKCTHRQPRISAQVYSVKYSQIIPAINKNT